MSGKKYFDRPTQVIFAEPGGDGWNAGIAYKDEIICGCCGGIFEIEEIYNFNEDIDMPIHEYSDWVDIAEEITGGELPDTFEG